MKHTTIGRLLINSVLPPALQQEDRRLDKKGIKALLQEVAEKYPDEYARIAHNLSNIGHDAAFTTGGYSFGLKALRQTVAAQKMRMALHDELDKIYGDKTADPATMAQRILDAVSAHQKTLPQAVMDESLKERNPIARQVLSGARGNVMNLNSLRGADLLYTDHRGNPLPIPVTRSYSMGLRPHEYFAGAFGARKGVIDLKAATQDAGFFAKQLVQATHRLLVSGTDDDNPYDETAPRGLPVSTDDIDSEGALLAHPVGGYKRNTVLTPRILKELRNNGVNDILVRSPTVGGPYDGGVYANDVGVREKSRIAPVGDYVGIAGAQALAEPVTQAQISSKHSGGVAGASAGAISGFAGLNQLVQVPKVFQGGAAHSQHDGPVTAVREAPQGGFYVSVGGKEHYVSPEAKVTVKVGDQVEAGDVLSDGTPNPAEIVKFKGIGEGRRYFVNAFRTALQNSKTFGHRRNIELLARGLINHVRLTDEVGDFIPDDVVPYQQIEAQWQPREGFTHTPVNQTVGKYLEKPVLHYTIGTRVQKSMLPTLQAHGVKNLTIHNDPPPFEPEMIRGMASAAHDPDWMTRTLGSYQKDSLLDAVHRGAVSDTAGTSFVPALASGSQFGISGKTQGWKSP